MVATVGYQPGLTLESPRPKAIFPEVHKATHHRLAGRSPSMSLKYTPEGGGISVRASRRHKAHVRLAVSDTAKGVPKGPIQHIFEIFDRTEAARTLCGYFRAKAPLKR